VKRSQFFAGIGAGLASAPLPGEACQYKADSDAFKRFTRWTGCQAKFRGRIPEVYTTGDGPSVLILHEVTGADPAVFAFAERVARRGFAVFVPVLFGTANHREDDISAAAQVARICVTREFACFETHQSSAVVVWVRQLGTAVYQAASGRNASTRGIGVVGLCLTGNFALAMAADIHLLAPVVCEPALPFAILAPSDVRASLGLSEKELDALRSRLHSGMDVAAFRFADDPIVPDERMSTLKQLLRSTPATLYGNVNIKPTCPNAHAVFTDHFNPNSPHSIGAFQQLIEFLHARVA
jgi:dienelactone hydrolase